MLNVISSFIPFLTAVCKPGSYSPTGLEPCFLCQKGDYQPLEGQRSCLTCSANTTTPGEGFNSSLHCGGNIITDNYTMLVNSPLGMNTEGEGVATCSLSPFMTETLRAQDDTSVGWLMQFLLRAQSHAERFPKPSSIP